MTLYNCHTDGDQYRITKFDSDGNVESTYLCTEDECECPAGVRPTCRHRQMLPRFLNRGFVNTHYFHDYDRNGWVLNSPAQDVPIEEEIEPRSGLLGEYESVINPTNPALDNALDVILGPHSPMATTTAFDAVDSGSIPLVAAKAAWRRV